MIDVLHLECLRIIHGIGVAVEGGAVAGEEDDFKVVVSEDLSGEV